MRKQSGRANSESTSRDGSEPLKFEEIAEILNIPRKALRVLKEKKIISYPVTEREMIGLELLAKTWGMVDLLSLQLKGKHKRVRERLITTAGLTKPESYVYNRIIKLGAGETITMKQLVGELKNYYGIPDTVAQNAAKKGRKKAYNDRYARKRQDIF